MKKGDYLATILRSDQTVFSFKDVSLLWGAPGTNTARVRINYYVKNGDLLALRKGIYAKDKNYNKSELATKIFVPAYIGFETVLVAAGLIFQYYNQIFVASYLTRTVEIDDQIYTFKKVKDVILTNQVGIENKNTYWIASTERAFLDTIYINTDYHFDNLSPLDWDKVFEILPIYNNQAMSKKVKKLHDHYQLNQ